jgi:hypothetical protein
MGDAQLPAPAQISMTKAQRDDFARLLARFLTGGNIAWLATAALGPEAVQQAGNDVGDIEAFARSIVQALQDAGRISDAVALLRQEARYSELTLRLNHILNGYGLDSDEAKQSFVNQYEPFLNVAETLEMLPRVLRTVCAVALGKPICKIMGSGFLIAPDVVMTNFHVVEHFLNVDQQTGVISPTAEGDQLFFFFDYLWEPAPNVPPKSARHTSICVTAAKDWLIHAREKLPNDGRYPYPTTVNMEYDYAVIKLARPVGNLPARRSGGAKRGWLQLQDHIDVLAQEMRVLVFQHPETAPQQFDIGKYVQLDPSGTRVWYNVSTAKGSSGGAAVDTEGRLFALHNAEVQLQPPPPNKVFVNQGVRIDLIKKDLAAVAPGLADMPEPAEEDTLFWSLNDDLIDSRPIIGRMGFREMVTRMLAQDAERVLVVTGPPGSGRQYSIDLLRRTLGIHVPVVVFSPKDLQTLAPKDFLRALVEGLGLVGLAKYPIPDAPKTEGMLQWLRLDLPKWLASRLSEDAERDAAKYPAWVVINASVPLDERLLWAEILKDFVAALVGVHDPGQTAIDVPQLRWLFLALDAASLPVSGVRKLEDDLSNYNSQEADFAECLQLAWRSVYKDAQDQDLQLMKSVARQLVGLKPAGLGVRMFLADRVRDMIKDEAQQISGGQG